MDLCKAKTYYTTWPELYYRPLELPYEGPAAILLKDVDSEENKPQKLYRAHVATFATWIPAELEVYTLAKSWIGRGWGLSGVERMQAVPDKGGWSIFMRWADSYCRVLSPEDKAQRTIPNQSPTAESGAELLLDHANYAKVFRSDDPEHMQAYTTVLQQTMDSRATIDKEDIMFEDKTQAWLIFIQWREYFLRTPRANGR